MEIENFQSTQVLCQTIEGQGIISNRTSKVSYHEESDHEEEVCVLDIVNLVVDKARAGNRII